MLMSLQEKARARLLGVRLGCQVHNRALLSEVHPVYQITGQQLMQPVPALGLPRTFIVALLSTILLLLLTTPLAHSHSGGLDAYGCHHDRKRGGYHCHRGQLAGQSFKSKDEMLKQLKAAPRQGPETQKKKSSE